MKQELPFAVVLLAAGSLLWFWQFDQEKPAVFEIQPFEKPASAIADAGIDDLSAFSSRVVQAEYQTELPEAGERESNEFSTSEETSASDPHPASVQIDAYIHQQTDRQSVQLMAKISERLASSQPFGSELHLKGDLFGRSVTAHGTYSQMGQGTHKSRIELKFGVEANAPSVFQLCDGRFVYNLQTRQMPRNAKGKKQTFEFVDLLRVQQTAGERATRITPTGWIATGGISGFLQHFASAFNFGAAESTADNSIVLRGSWDPESLRSVTGRPLVGGSDSRSPIRWEDVPLQLPHAVEICLKQNSELLYFPTKITFLKFVIHNKQKRYNLERIVTLLLSQPQPLENITDRFFVIDSSNLDSIDTTDRYIARIDAFEQTRQAAEQMQTLDR